MNLVKHNRIFILDTSVLLIDPNSIYAYRNANIIVPFSVIEELDRFKHQLNDIGRHARLTISRLDEFNKSGSMSDGLNITDDIILSIWIEADTNKSIPVFAEMSRSSNRVLSAALSIKSKFDKHKVFLVTNDMNLRIKAGLFGIDSGNYFEEQLSTVCSNKALFRLELGAEQINDLNKFDYSKIDGNGLYPNQHLLVNDSILCRYISRNKYLKKIKNFSDGIWNIVPRNIEQIAALDILMDNGIDIVTLAGKAGTGKTLLALAAALESVFNEQSGRRILVSRPIIPLGKDIGFLPGTIEEKILPWMQPIFDNLELLISRQAKSGFKLGSVDRLLEKKIIEIEALTYIRGRSIPNRWMIVDEAQNLTPHEVKTIITRCGDNTKIVLTGDPYQIDNPYIDEQTNGLSYVVSKFRSYPEAAFVCLLQGERSKLAELAADVL